MELELVCNQCNNSIENSHKFCPHCGSAIKEVKFWDSSIGKIIRYIVFIPVYLIVLGIMKSLIGLVGIILFSLSLKYFLLLFFTIGLVGYFFVAKMIPLYLIYLVEGLCPNRKLALYSFIILIILTMLDLIYSFFNTGFSLLEKNSLTYFYTAVYMVIILSVSYSMITAVLFANDDRLY